MIPDMPRQRPPHLHRELTRHGKAVWYVRVGKKAPRVRLRAEYGSEAFKAEYAAAMAGESPVIPGRPSSGTLAWLVAQYRETNAWTRLSLATRRQRENILKRVLETAGRDHFVDVNGKVIQAGIERRRHTPAQARHFVDTMRGLFRWAVSAEHVKSDPTVGRAVPKLKTKGFPVWTDADIEAFEKRWPRGTRQRVMFDIFLFTGIRRGDAAILGKQHVRNGVITLDTEKNDTRVTLPLLFELEQTLAAGPTGDLAFITTEAGNPMTKESLGNAFSEAARAAGVRKSAHGLRKAAATHAANRGATVAQLEAIFGWEGGRMASLYTRSADRQALAAAAMGKLSRTATPAPDGKVRVKDRKE